MRGIVIEPSVAIPAVLFPHGRRRKLLVLAAYGGLTHFEKFAGVDEAELARREAAAASSIGGPPFARLIERAREVKAILAEQLPIMTPDDVCLIASRQLLDEVEEKMKLPRLRRHVEAPDAPAIVRRQLTALAAVIVPDFVLEDVPRYTEGRDRRDDYILHTALTGGAFAVVSDDRRHIALSADEPTIYSGKSGAVVPAYQLAPFIEDVLNTFHFDFDEIDGAILDRVNHLLEPFART